MSAVSLYGYSTGPMITSSGASYLDAKVLNNDRKPAQVRIKQYDLIAIRKVLLVDHLIEIPARGSAYLGLVLLDTWEVQFITNSSLVRFWVGVLDDNLNLQPGGVVLHTQLLKFSANSLAPQAKKRQPEIMGPGYRE
ncbi:MAG: hypothetical protein ACM3O9_02730 [Methylocystaceae bacterium]